MLWLSISGEKLMEKLAYFTKMIKENPQT